MVKHLLFLLLICSIVSSKSLSDTTHPRLFLDSAQWADLPNKVSVPPMFGWDSLRILIAGWLLSDTVVDYTIPGGDVSILQTLNYSKEQVETWAYAYIRTQDTSYAVRIWEELEAMNAVDWNDYHFLDCATRIVIFSIAYDWVYDYWSEEQKDTIISAITNKGLVQVLKDYEETERSRQYYWSREKYNWSFVCDAAAIVGAITIGSIDSVFAQKVLDSAQSHLEWCMPSFFPDGGYVESLNYMWYSLRFLGYGLSAMESALGVVPDLVNSPGFSDSWKFKLYMDGPKKIWNIHDDPASDITNIPEFFWILGHFGNKDFMAYNVLNKKSNTYNSLFYLPEMANEAYSFPLDNLFDSLEMAMFRSGFSDTSTFTGLRAGYLYVNHGDMDAGTFILDALGERWAEDMGPESYSVPGYWDREVNGDRWNYYRKRTEGQNTILINPDSSGGQELLGSLSIIDYRSSDESSYAISDLTNVYVGLDSYMRGLKLYNNRTNIIVQDELIISDTTEVYWFMHTKASIYIDGNSAVLTKNSMRLFAKILSPASAVFTEMTATPLPTSPDPVGNNPNTGYDKLTIHISEMVEDETISVLFVPLNIGDPIPTSFPEVTPLSRWWVSSGFTSDNSLEGSYEFQTVDHISGVALFGSLTSGLDTINGDSVKALNNYSPKTHQGWEDIITTNALSGDSAAVSRLQLVVKAYDKNDFLISNTIIDTFADVGSSILIPFGARTGLFGEHFDIWFKSAGTGSEIVVDKVWHRIRRNKKIENSFQ